LSWDSNVLFPIHHKSEFDATLIHLKNLTAISIDNYNAAVATAVAHSKSANKTIGEYFKGLEHIRLSESKPISSIDNVLITALIFNVMYILLGRYLVGILSIVKVLIIRIILTLLHTMESLFTT
jgi:hypothetical protein